ncbi:hypothetical protein HPP92_004086 [Vanilla planifolia]|uniref:BHLH domain-containing protein n=1 Tax=Vanilla planifolia TaxID=51239 RepID=A0A835S309_VANPL|nr:hypothetical protein HPP92_004086 [Vanilla planifolia]
MWKYNNLNSGYSLWPPDVEQKQPSNSICNNPCNCFLGNALGNQGSSHHLNSAFVPHLNPQRLSPANGCLGPGEPCPTTTKRFLVFDQSGDQTSLIYSSVAIPCQFFNPPIPASNLNYERASNSHVSKDHEEMHEDTEEIDALLYSESEHTYDSDENSTGHSPLILEEEETDNPPIPAKRRRLELPELDPSLTDTASSANLLNYHSFPGDENDTELSYVDGFREQNFQSGEEDKYAKRERIRRTMDMLRRVIPGGECKDAVELLDEAIRYLKSLRLQAKGLDANTMSI